MCGRRRTRTSLQQRRSGPLANKRRLAGTAGSGQGSLSCALGAVAGTGASEAGREGSSVCLPAALGRAGEGDGPGAVAEAACVAAARCGGAAAAAWVGTGSAAEAAGSAGTGAAKDSAASSRAGMSSSESEALRLGRGAAVFTKKKL